MANPPITRPYERLQGADIEERPGLPHDEHEPDRDDDRQQHEQEHTDPRSGGPQRDEGAREGDGEGDTDAHRTPCATRRLRNADVSPKLARAPASAAATYRHGGELPTHRPRGRRARGDRDPRHRRPEREGPGAERRRRAGGPTPAQPLLKPVRPSVRRGLMIGVETGAFVLPGPAMTAQRAISGSVLEELVEGLAAGGGAAAWGSIRGGDRRRPPGGPGARTASSPTTAPSDPVSHEGVDRRRGPDARPSAIDEEPVLDRAPCSMTVSPAADADLLEQPGDRPPTLVAGHRRRSSATLCKHGDALDRQQLGGQDGRRAR